MAVSYTEIHNNTKEGHHCPFWSQCGGNCSYVQKR